MRDLGSGRRRRVGCDRRWGARRRAGDGPEDATRLLVETIDRLIAAGWDEHRVEPAAPADDAEFLRRVSLDLTGKIPSAGEAHEFLEDPQPGEAASGWSIACSTGPAYVVAFHDHRAAADDPRGRHERATRLVAPAFEAWLRGQVAGNVGNDRVVRAILTVPVAADRPGSARGGPSLGRVPGAVAPAVLHGQGSEEREPRGEHGPAVPGSPARMRPVPQPPVRLVDP